MLGTKAEYIAHDLLEYGEPETAAWMGTCSDDELVRICSVADWLLLHGPTSPSGASMQVGKACALAAVYVREGQPRDLARKRRASKPRPSVEGVRFVNYQLQVAAPRDYGVGDDARGFWQS